jgi:hypothetical protein
MADDRKSQSAAGGARGYKRSWKNLLINKRYQLRFTLFMVGLSAVLMAGLGWWVLRVADEATEVAASRVRGDGCPPMPTIAEPGAAPAAEPAEGDADGDADAPTPVEPAPAEGGKVVQKPGEPAPGEVLEDGGRRKVVIEESTMTVTEAPAEPVPPDFAQMVAAHYECELRQAAKLDALEAGRRQILYVLFAACALLTIALAIYGIKMTHKVAGPLYKISLYMGKMRDGRLDTVYNLRKGDQLVSFYEHFKQAHAGIVDLEKADIARIKAIVAAAEAAGVAGTSPEVDAALADLKAVLARKEKSLE